MPRKPPDRKKILAFFRQNKAKTEDKITKSALIDALSDVFLKNIKKHQKNQKNRNNATVRAYPQVKPSKKAQKIIVHH